ncbi:MAG: MFS transporter, partial [bacterium]|nr:MFS transporter [bacterium]
MDAHRIMSRLTYHRHRRLRRAPEPHGVSGALRTVAWSRTIRWIGWGFGESLIPILIFSFSSTYAEAGLIRSVFEIVLLICFPLVGVLADRVSARTLILAGAVVYPLVGFGYLLAGITGLAIFLVFARAANAIGWALESTGVDTYYRRMASRTSMNSSFGFIDTLAGSGWVIAALIGILLVPYVPIHVLLFIVAPTSIIAGLIAARAPHDSPQPAKKPTGAHPMAQSYRLMLVEWKSWNGNLRLLGALSFFVGIIEALIWFFIPIDAYVEGTKLSLVILLTVVASIPPMFGYAIGKIADRRNPYALIAAGLVGAAAILLCIAIFPQ